MKVSWKSEKDFLELGKASSFLKGCRFLPEIHSYDYRLNKFIPFSNRINKVSIIIPLNDNSKTK